MEKASTFFLPEGFLSGLRESYKYFFFKTIVDLCIDHDELDQYEVISHMVALAWPLVIENNVFLGESDRLEEICQSIFQDTGSLECPSENSILCTIKSEGFAESISDISRVFSRFVEAWVGKRYVKDFISEKSSDDVKAPYFFSIAEGKVRMVFLPYWKNYCLENRLNCDKLYACEVSAFLEKRNRYSKEVRRGLERVFSSFFTDTGKEEETDTGKEEESVSSSITGSTDSTSDLLRIPLSFLLRPALIPRSGSFRAYRLNPPQADTLNDLFNGPIRKRHSTEVIQSYVYQHRDRLERAYKYYQDVPVIPLDLAFDLSIGMMLSTFIHEYVDRISCRNALLEPKEKEKMDTKLRVFSTIYDSRNLLNSDRNVLAAELGLHPERVRQILVGANETIGIQYITNLLNGLVSTEDFIVNPILQSSYLEFSYSCLLAERLDDFDRRCGEIDSKTKALLMDSLDLHLCDAVSNLEPFVIKGDYITFIRRNFGSVIKYFNEEVIYVSLEDEFIPFFKEKLGLDYTDPALDVTVEIIKHSFLFEAKEVDGTLLFGLKWENLSSVSSRLSRILFEIGTVTHYTKVYEEYNRRAKLFGLQEEIIDEKFSTRSHPYIKTQGKTGYWFFDKENDSALSETSKTQLQVVQDYVVQSGGIVKEEETIAFLESLGYSINPKTIKAYLKRICKESKEQRGSYVYKEWVDRFPEMDFGHSRNNDASSVMPIILKELVKNNGVARISDLIQAYQKATGKSIRDNAIQQIINRWPDQIIQRYQGRNKYIVLAVSPEEALSLDSEFFKAKEPDYYTQIRKRIIHLLNGQDGKCMKLSLLVQDVSSLVPSGRHRNVIYKIINKMEEVEVYLVDGIRFIRIKL